MSNFKKVREFHEAFGMTVNDEPNPNNPLRGELDLRFKLIHEEFNELMEAILTKNDINEITKELADLLYVVYGTGVSMGVDLDKAFDLVHQSNMSKLDDDGKPIYREDGKVLKSHNYRPPDLTEVTYGKHRPRDKET
jgi:predicted HAD superfamily Cof-like phosphohydrolase